MSTGKLSAIILCGPSGAGKSSLLKKLIEDYPQRFGFSVSHTTRKPRPGEENGVHYHFTTVDDIEEQILSGNFIENATFSGNIYGTSHKAIQDVLEAGKICILDIDVQGVKQVKQTHLNPWFVFIKPPSLKSLEERLRARNTETDESLLKRLSVAAQEIEFGEYPGNFDAVIVNDDLEQAYNQLKTFVTSKVF